MTHDEAMGGWRPIESAPRDGRALWVADPDAGCFLMAWDRNATNHLFAPGKSGMWVAIGDEMTWSEHDGCGPTRWADGAEPCPFGWHEALPPAPETAEGGAVSDESSANWGCAAVLIVLIICTTLVRIFG